MNYIKNSPKIRRQSHNLATQAESPFTSHALRNMATSLPFKNTLNIHYDTFVHYWHYMKIFVRFLNILIFNFPLHGYLLPYLDYIVCKKVSSYTSMFM